MTMATFLASSLKSHPPHILHSSTPIPPSEALTLLSAYLKAAESDASLHPNAILTLSGPVLANTGTQVGLVLHNLRRVEAGLRGEHLAEEEEELSLSHLGTAAGDDLPDSAGGTAEKENGAGWEEGEKTADRVKEQEPAVEGWQDMAEYEREQEEVQGDVDGDNEVMLPSMGDVPTVEGTTSTEDKAARKKRKEEKRKRKEVKLDKLKEKKKKKDRRRREKSQESD